MAGKKQSAGALAAAWERVPGLVRAGFLAAVVVVIVGLGTGRWSVGVALLAAALGVGIPLGGLLVRRRLRLPAHEPATPGGATAAISRWPELTAPPSPLSKALAGSTAEVWRKDAVGWTLRVTLAPGRTADEVQALSAALESALDVRRGSLRVLPDERARRVAVKVVTKDLLSEPIRWAAPPGRSISDPVHLGVFEDGAPCELRLLPAPGGALNVALAGLPGSGKSSVLNVLIAALAACRDVVLAGVDPAGVEMGPWEGCFDPELLALDVADAETVLLRLLAKMAERNRLLRAKGVRVWTPSPEHPELVLFVDEAAALREHMGLLDKLASQGRKAGMHVVVATQRPSSEALGAAGKELLAKQQVKIALRLATRDDVDVAMGRGSATEGWRSDLVCRRRGEFLIRSDQHPQPRVARGLLVTDHDVETWAAQCARVAIRGEA